MKPSAKILEQLAVRPMSARRLTDTMVSGGYAWPGADQEVTIKRVQSRLTAMLLKGQVTRRKVDGVWVWLLP